LGKLLSRTVLGIAIGVLFVWLSAEQWPMEKLAGAIGLVSGHLVVGNVDLEALIATGAESGDGWAMNLALVLPYLVVLTLIHVLRVVRFKPLLDPITDLDWTSHNRIGSVGFMAMFLMPIRLGELVRPYLTKVASDGETRTSEVLSTVVVERIADGLVVTFVLFSVMTLLPSRDAATAITLVWGAFASMALFVGASVFLGLMVWKHDQTMALIEATIGRVLPGPTSKVIDLGNAFVGGLKRLPSPIAFAHFIALTVVYWLINGIGVYLMARAFYLPVDGVGAYAMMSCVVVGMMVPNSPGNVGSFWYFLLLPLPLYGVEAGSVQAIAFGVMVWWLQLVQQTAFGAWFVVRGQITWRLVLEATQETEEAHHPSGAAP